MKNTYKYVMTIIITLVVGVVSTLVVSSKVLMHENISKTIKEVNVKEENTLKYSIEKIYNAVYYIGTYNNDELIGSGTGFVYKKDDNYGYILTNHHVIEKGNKYKITNSNGDIIEAKYLGSDAISDLAVLSIDQKLVNQVASLGNTDDSSVGDTVFTVGSPLGSKYIGTVTKGILSGKNRQVIVDLDSGEYVIDVMQTDAAINPGNSGGPLLNINGEVIGITSLKLVEDEIEGMGFALPIEIASAYLDRLEKGEKIIRPLLGVNVVDIDKNSNYMYAKYGLEVQQIDGILVIATEENSPAKDIFKKGDVIIKINDVKVTSSALFKYNLYKCEVGQEISVTYIRNNKENTVKIKLVEH